MSDNSQGVASMTANVTLASFSDENFLNDNARLDTPITPLVDLAISGSVVGDLVVGDTGTVEIAVSNDGVGTVETDLTVSLFGATIQSPAAFGTGWTCDTFLDSATCQYLGTVGPGASPPPLTYEGEVGPTSDGTLELSASVHHLADQRFGNNTVGVSGAVTAPIDVVVELTGPTTDLVAGTSATYTAVVANTGGAASDGQVSLSFFPDGGLEIVGAAGDGWDCFFTSCTNDAVVPAGGSWPPVTMTVTPRYSYDARAYVSAQTNGGGDGLTGNNTSDVTTPFPPRADAVTAIEADAPAFAIGGPAGYTAIVSNPGVDAVDGPVLLNVSLDFAITGIVATGDGWACSGGFVSCEHPGPIPSGGSLPAVAVSGVVDNTFATSVSAYASVHADADQRRDNNDAEVLTPIGGESDLTGVLTGDPATFGGPVAVAVTVTNVLDTEAVGPVEVVISPASGLLEPSASGDGWTCDESQDQFDPSVCSTSGPVSASGTLPPIVVSGTAGATGEGIILVNAEIRGATDGNRDNDFVSVEIPVATPVDLTVAVDDGDVAYVALEPGIAVITVSNIGTATTTAPISVDVGVSPLTATADAAGDGWTCDGLTCTHPGPVAAGSQLPPLTITVTPTASTQTVVTDAIVTSPDDGRTGNDFASEDTPVVSVVDLTVDVDDGGASIVAGSTGSYAVTVANSGSAPSVGEIAVALTTTGPSTITAASGSGWTCAVAATTTCTTSATSDPGDASPTITVDVVTTTDGGSFVGLSAEVSGGGDARPFDNADFEQTPLASPDLVVAVDDAGATFTAPGSGQYTVDVGNRGGAPTLGTVSVTLDASETIAVAAASGDGWTCAVADGFGTCTSTQVVAVGDDFAPITVTVDVIATVLRTAALTATASGFDANAVNSTATENTPVVVPADLAVTLTSGAAWVVGRESSAVVTVTNVGAAAATGPVTATLSRGTAGTGDGWTCAVDGLSLVCGHAGPVAAGTSLPALTITDTPVLADEPVISLGATVDDPSDGTPENDTTSLALDVVVAVDLDVDIAATPPFTVGQPASASVIVANLGAEAALGTVTLTVGQNQNGFPTVGGDGWTCLSLFGLATCTHPGPVPAGGSLPPVHTAFEVTIADYPATSLSSTVAHPDDVRPTNDNASVGVPTKGVDLEVDVLDGGAGTAAEIGDTRHFTVTAENVGGLAPPGAATLVVMPGPGLLRGAFTGTGWSCSPDGNTFTCSTTEPVPAEGGLAPLGFEAYVGGDAYPSTDLEVQLTAPAESRIDEENDAGVGFEVIGAPNLVLAIDAPATVAVDGGFEASIDVTNKGVVATTGITTVDIDVPAGLAAGAGTGENWSCQLIDAGGVLRCQTTEVAEAESTLPPVTIGFTVGLGAYPRINLHADVDNANDGDPLDNNADSGTDVIGIPDLQPDVEVGQLVADRANAATIAIENIGTEPADAPTTVTVDLDDTDAGVTATSGAGDGWTCSTPSGGALTCSHPGPVPAGGDLPELTIELAVDGERYDVGTTCRAEEFGDRLLRACRNRGVPGLIPFAVDVANTANVLGHELAAADLSGVAQPVDVVASSSTEHLHPGALATIRTTARNNGTEASPGPVVLVQRVECGLLVDLAQGEQGSCLPGTDVLEGVRIVDVTADGWTCATADGVVTCTHPGPVAPGAALPEVVVTADIAGDQRGTNLWIAPTIDAAGDTNPNNDQPEDGRAVRLRPDPDLAVHVLSSADYTVGVNDLITVQVTNTSDHPIEGTTSLNADLGAGFQYQAVQGDEWTCEPDASVASCTTAHTFDPGGLLVLSLVMTPLIAGVPQQAVSFEVDNAADTEDRNDRAARVARVFDQPQPNAVLGVDRTVTKVNQPLDFDASFSENTFPGTTFRWDFGDGVTSFGETVAHTYERPGTYTAVLRVSNGSRMSKDTARVIVVPDEPLVADAGDDRVAEEQLMIAFDGGASLPFYAIESFEWDFGDATEPAVGRSVQHIYGEPGIYDVTLTIRSGTETATDTLVVDVREQGSVGAGGGLQVTVVDTESEPVRAADVAVLDADGVRHSARTDDAGLASIRNLPDGRYAVYAYRLGFLPVVGRARVSGGLGTAGVTLERGAVGEATLEQRQLTIDEIITAGIDVNDPANLNILEFEIKLGFSVDPGVPDFLG
ncbi:MAG: PKD domain-containing protein, partial [Candidatus Limnocylindrales bacterium]